MTFFNGSETRPEVLRFKARPGGILTIQNQKYRPDPRLTPSPSVFLSKNLAELAYFFA
jgi:hypothetical protein